MTGAIFRNPKLLPAAAAFAVISIGALMRLTALDWDDMAGLHADERHMAFMVSGALRGLSEWGLGKLPLDWTGLWFDTERSPLNPRLQSGFYVYGEAPLLVMVLLSYVQGWSEWTEVLLTGRMLSAIADSCTILLVFLTAARWTRSRAAPVLACSFYAFTPVAMREAHFFTVDTLSTAFGLAAVYAASFWNDSASRLRNSSLAIAMGVLLGLSVASKLSGALFAFALVFIVIAKLWAARGWRVTDVAVQAVFCLLAAAVAFRLANPFAFTGPNVWNIGFDPRFLDDVAEQSRLASAGAGWVPNWFWLDRNSFLQFLQDVFLWGFGPAIVAAACLAVLLRWRTFSPFHLAACCFVATVLAIFSTYPTPYLRYVLPIAPFVMIIAGQLLAGLRHRGLSVVAVSLAAAAAIQAQAVLGMLIAPHTRVEASVFIWKTLPLGSVILNETGWDETLPAVVRVPGDKESRWPFVEGKYELQMLNIQEPDSAQKATWMAERLSRADLLVQSSQRFFAVVPRMADRLPMSSRYYRMLDDGSLCFEKFREFRRGLTLLGFLEIDDSFAQESWFIYDHPIVRLYRRTGCFDRQKVEKALLDALPK